MYYNKATITFSLFISLSLCGLMENFVVLNSFCWQNLMISLFFPPQSQSPVFSSFHFTLTHFSPFLLIFSLSLSYLHLPSHLVVGCLFHCFCFLMRMFSTKILIQPSPSPPSNHIAAHPPTVFPPFLPKRIRDKEQNQAIIYKKGPENV